MATVHKETVCLVTSSSFGKTDQTETLEIHSFTTTPAIVKVGAERVINLGNYNSLRVSVHIEIPCYVEEVTNITAKATSYVMKRMDKAVTAFGGDLATENK